MVERVRVVSPAFHKVAGECQVEFWIVAASLVLGAVFCQVPSLLGAGYLLMARVCAYLIEVVGYYSFSVVELVVLLYELVGPLQEDLF